LADTPPIILFDRCVGTAIPEALRLLDMKHVYHHHIQRAKIGKPPLSGKDKLFQHDTKDDEWMAYVAAEGWVVITQDYALPPTRRHLANQATRGEGLLPVGRASQKVRSDASFHA